MTTPTQAQIEALRWISNQRDNEDADIDDICTRADRALTAAAQVGEQDLLQKCLTNIEATGKALEASTIERCAQVVNEILEKTWDATAQIALQDAIAAIRKLKDEP